MRSRVDFPHPDGPRMVMKSLSSIESETGVSARVGWPPRVAGNSRPTPSMASLVIVGNRQQATGDVCVGRAEHLCEARLQRYGRECRASLRCSHRPTTLPVACCPLPPLSQANLHGNNRWFIHFTKKSETSPITPMTRMPKMICPVFEQRLAVDDHVPDARRRADQLRDDDVGPRPTEHQPQNLGDLRRGMRESARGWITPCGRCAPSVYATPRRDRAAPLPTATATISTSWKNEPMKITSSFCSSPMPAHRMRSGMKADAGR